jgi:hypothetical protein
MTTTADLLAAVQADYAALGSATFATQGAIYAKLGTDLAALQAALAVPPPPAGPPALADGSDPITSDSGTPLTGA